METGLGPNPALPVMAGIPIDLYESIRGRFFLGYADGLAFGKGAGAWAGLFNPPDSGINLYVWAFGITNVAQTPYRIQIWFNAVFPGEPRLSGFVSPANTALTPRQIPKVQLRYAVLVDGTPAGGVKAFVRRGEPGVTINSVEDGKFIFPPGGSYTVFLSNPETPEAEAAGRISFQWWEETIRETAGGPMGSIGPGMKTAVQAPSMSCQRPPLGSAGGDSQHRRLGISVTKALLSQGFCDVAPIL